MNILIVGGTGFIGSALTAALKKNHTITIASRTNLHQHSPCKTVYWHPQKPELLLDTLANSDVLINLAGAPINSVWTKRRKVAILQSRLETTRALVTILRTAPQKPHTFINASAVGYYGSRGEEIITEETPNGSGFLADVCKQWETEALKATERSLRVVLLRTGIILSMHGGMLPRIVLPMKLFVGASIGEPHQWIPWIHMTDVVRAIEFLIENTDIAGPVNLTAPQPSESRDFYRTLAQYLHRPLWFRIPPFIITSLFGEMGKELLLTSQRVLPAVLLHHGFKFQFENIGEALSNILAQRRRIE